MKVLKKSNHSVIGIVSTIFGVIAIISTILLYQFTVMMLQANYFFMGFYVIYIVKFLYKLEIVSEVIGLLLGVIAVVRRKRKIMFGIIGIIINGGLLIWVLYSIISQKF